MLLRKLEEYLKPLNIKSGIDPEKCPDKEWMILAIATVSGGKDEIFDPMYMPSRDAFGLQKQNINQHVFDPQVPFHLLGFGKGRHLKLGGATREEKVEQQLKAAEARVAKQQ